MRNKPNQGPVTTSANATMPGGASGVPTVDTEKALPMESRTVQPITPRPDVKVQQFRVMNGGPIMYNNGRILMRAGKIIDEKSYDLEKLRQQGIRLEPIEDGAPAPAAG